ncbi:MAG: Tol-Pal system beta propeller repeat protein TolB [Rhodospirillales bacterium]
MRSLGLAGLLVAVSLLPARAEIEIDITEGFFSPLAIAVPTFSSPDGTQARLGRDIAEVVAADLERSGLFRPIDSGAFIQSPESLASDGVRFGDWRLINAAALVVGYTQSAADGRLQAGFRLFDVQAEEEMEGFEFTAAPANWRSVAHKIADRIYSRLTGEEGYFDTRIVYVAESGAQDRRVKRLAIMDQDSANQRFLTDGTAVVLSPQFSPTRQEITYVSFVPGMVPRVSLYNLDTGQREVIGNFDGMSFAPRFSPDGDRVVMAVARDGNSDIYVMDLRTRNLRRLTTGPGIDISPSFSPDGSQIVFESDRSGSQQLYIMGAGGGGATRLTFGAGRYATPSWSPRGDYIAFTRQHQGQFSIGVIAPDGSGERILSTGYRVEAPTWAPNGRVLAFFRQGRSDTRGSVASGLYSIDITGYNERALPTATAASDPTWSPLNP